MSDSEAPRVIVGPTPANDLFVVLEAFLPTDDAVTACTRPAEFLARYRAELRLLGEFLVPAVRIEDDGAPRVADIEPETRLRLEGPMLR